MKRIKCPSGLEGWQCRLQESYASFEEWDGYSEIYSLADRLGFASAQEAWDANPEIMGSVEPSDFGVVQSVNNPSADAAQQTKQERNQ